MNQNLLPIARALKTRPLFEAETVELEVYVWDKTQDGEDCFEFETWVGLIAHAVCDVAGGCQETRGTGYWVKKSDGKLCRDGLAVIKATVPRSDLLENIGRIRYVLVQYGRECQQEYVALKLNGELYVINPAEHY